MKFTIELPDTYPAIPEGFSLYQVLTVGEFLSVLDDSRPDEFGLRFQATRLAECGYKSISLIVVINSNQDRPDRQIYSEWDVEKCAWGEWMDYSSCPGEKFDFEEFYKPIDEPESDHTDAQYDMAKEEGKIPW